MLLSGQLATGLATGSGVAETAKATSSAALSRASTSSTWESHPHCYCPHSWFKFLQALAVAIVEWSLVGLVAKHDGDTKGDAGKRFAVDAGESHECTAWQGKTWEKLMVAARMTLGMQAAFCVAAVLSGLRQM